MTAPALRPYLPTDASVLAAIFRDAIEELTGEDYSPAQQVAWSEAADDEEAFGARLAGSLTLVATIVGEPVGFASLKGADLIDMVFVAPSVARQGVATLLVDALEKLAAARGAKALTVEASDTAEPFFAGRGYQAQARQSVPRGGEWLANTVMKKTLAPHPGAATGGHA